MSSPSAVTAADAVTETAGTAVSAVMATAGTVASDATATVETVVSAGIVYWVTEMPSMAMTEQSSGMARPCSRRARMAPIAMSSAMANSAVKSSYSASRAAVAR